MEEKPKTDYIFRVFVIRDGECSGLLLERRRAAEVLPTHAYFWHTGPGGLPPTAEIKKYVGGCSYPIEWSEKHKGNRNRFANLRDQERVFLELKIYAEAEAASEQKKNVGRPFQYEYTESEKGYAGVLSRFFSRKSDLRVFRPAQPQADSP